LGKENAGIESITMLKHGILFLFCLNFLSYAKDDVCSINNKNIESILRAGVGLCDFSAYSDKPVDTILFTIDHGINIQEDMVFHIKFKMYRTFSKYKIIASDDVHFIYKAKLPDNSNYPLLTIWQPKLKDTYEYLDYVRVYKNERREGSLRASCKKADLTILDYTSMITEE